MIVAAPERWDEACFAVPAVRALAASGLAVGVLCAAERRGFWETLDGIAVVDFPEKSGAKAIAAALDGGWEAALVWEPGAAADAFRRAAIPRRLGPAGVGLEKSLTHPLTAAPGPLEHRVRFYLAIVEALGCAVARPEFFAPAPLSTAPDTDVVLLIPGSDFGANHEWPLDRWEEIAAALAADCIQIRTAGGAPARKLAERAGVDFTELAPSTAALEILAAHPLVVAADGSLPHLAAHAGATCVTLFGPGDPAWKRPRGTRHTVVRHHVECAPCLLPKCPLDLRCQRELDVATVLAAIRRKSAEG